MKQAACKARRRSVGRCETEGIAVHQAKGKPQSVRMMTSGGWKLNVTLVQTQWQYVLPVKWSGNWWWDKNPPYLALSLKRTQQRQKQRHPGSAGVLLKMLPLHFNPAETYSTGRSFIASPMHNCSKLFIKARHRFTALCLFWDAIMGPRFLVTNPQKCLSPSHHIRKFAFSSLQDNSISLSICYFYITFCRCLI